MPVVPCRSLLYAWWSHSRGAHHRVIPRPASTMTDHNQPDDHQHHKATDPYQHTFNPVIDSVSEELIRAVAVFNNADPNELAILAEVIDPEALDSLFQSHPNGRLRETDGHVTFEYNDHQIQIVTDGTITIGSRQPEGDD